MYQGTGEVNRDNNKVEQRKDVKKKEKATRGTNLQNKAGIKWNERLHWKKELDLTQSSERQTGAMQGTKKMKQLSKTAWEKN